MNSLLPAQTLPALPQAFVDTAYEPSGGQIITVVDSADFQAALDNEKFAAPWTVSWNTSSAAPGSRTLTAIARDAAAIPPRPPA